MRSAGPKLHPRPVMWATTAATVDFVHALLMTAWVAGLPLLFWQRWPRVTRAYGIYAVTFIVVSQASHLLLGECVFTTLARASLRLSTTAVSDEWFTVRVARAVFGLTPSHRIVVWISETLILVTALGVLASRRVFRRATTPAQPVRHPDGGALRGA